MAHRLSRPAILLAFALLAALPAAACGGGRLRVLVSMGDVGLVVGDSVRPQWAVVREHSGPLQPSFYQYDSFDFPERFTWQSSNPAVATVDARGMIRGVSPGEATVTATTRGLHAPPLRVFVEPPAGASRHPGTGALRIAPPDAPRRSAPKGVS